MAVITEETFLNTYRYFVGQPQQVAGVSELYALLLKTDPAQLDEGVSWLANYRKTPPEISHPPAAEEITPLNFTPASPFSLRITPNITYGEVCLHQEARRFVNQGQCDMAVELCQFAQRGRDHFNNGAVIITSGNRPPAINASVGGASNSEHLYRPGEGALDIYLNGTSIFTFEKWCDQNWPFSIGYGASQGFVHVGIRAGRPRVRWPY